MVQSVRDRGASGNPGPSVWHARRSSRMRRPRPVLQGSQHRL